MSSELDRLYRIRRTIMQMLRDRDYLIEDEELNMSKEQFRGRFGDEPKRESLITCKAKRFNPDDKIHVCLPEEAKVSVKHVRALSERMKSEGVRHAILVVQNTLSAISKSCIAELASQYRVETFLESELLVNVTEHALVPEHIVLTDVEKKELLQRYTVKESQLPRMLEADPVARYYGLKKGQVVKIIRPSETAGKYVTYRTVV